METKTFELNGIDVEVSTNGKVYGKTQYFTVTPKDPRGGRATKFEYNQETKTFKSNDRSAFASAIRDLFGL